MKKLIKTLLCLGAVLVMSCALSCFVSAETLSDGDYTYTVLADSTAEITKYNGAETDVTIPDTLGGYTVTSIGASAFKSNSNIQNVSFPETLISISERAFSYCYYLNSIRFPDSMRTVEDDAFMNCYRLETVILNEGLKSLGAYCFCNTSIKSIIIPSTLTSGGNATVGAFINCKELTTITFSEGMTVIPQYICREAVALTTINFSSTIETIDKYAFAECENLETLQIPGTIKSVEIRAFEECSKLKNLILNEGIQFLKEDSFYKCNALESVEIPTTVTYDGSSLGGAFAYCENLTTISFAEGRTIVPPYVCSDAIALKIINFSSSTEIISERSFENCKSLEKVVIPSNVKSILSQAFLDCKNLNELVLNEGLVTLESNAFANCHSLEAVVIPSTVTSDLITSSGPFVGCNNLTEITFAEGMTQIPACICAGLSGLEKINFPSTLTKIGYYSFRNCSSLTTLVIPDSVTYLSSLAFDGCFNLKKIIIPDSVSNISSSVFSGCNSIDTVIVFSNAMKNFSFPYNDNTTYFLLADSQINKPYYGKTIQFSYADGVLSFSGEYKSDLYDLFDLVAVMCTYYDDVQYLFFDSFEAVSADDGHIYYYTDNWQRIEFDGTKMTNVKFSVEAFDGEEFRKYSFNELCEAVGNNELENFNLVVEEADGLDRGNVEISLVDQISQSFTRILKAIVNLLNKLFAFFRR